MLDCLRRCSRVSKNDADSDKAPLPPVVSDWINEQMSLETAGRVGEWSEDEVYVSMPRPGGDAWMTIARDSGEIHYERTTRGVISFLNDLHKGRNAGPMWGGSSICLRWRACCSRGRGCSC